MLGSHRAGLGTDQQ